MDKLKRLFNNDFELSKLSELFLNKKETLQKIVDLDMDSSPSQIPETSEFFEQYQNLPKSYFSVSHPFLSIKKIYENLADSEYQKKYSFSSMIAEQRKF